MKRLITLLGVLSLSLAFVSCGEKQKPPPPVVFEAPDYKPIGEGMKVHSYAMIAVALVIVFAVAAGRKPPGS